MSSPRTREEGVEEMETEMSPEPTGGNPPSPQTRSPKPGEEVEPLPDNMQQEDEIRQDFIGPRLERGGATGVAEGDNDGEDPCRSEGIVHFVIRDFSKLSEQLLSEPTYIRNLPWRLLVMIRETTSTESGVPKTLRSLGVFVQCNPKSPESPSWNVSAQAAITLINQDNPKSSFTREIYHCFCGRENDWGFSSFMTLKDIMDPNKHFIKDDTIILQARVEADAPHGINWDSRKHTGYVGLKNQGATCYMNSLLQTLYCTTKLRKAVYEMPTDNDDAVRSVPLALQRLFYELQHSDKPVGTKKLTKSFGWDTMDIFMQHDIQELSRVLLDNIESKMKDTSVEGTIAGLFEGKMESYVRCTNVDYESTRIETFFDIQLNIKGKKNVLESFEDYVCVETLDGENKYDAGDHGLQEAKKGVVFVDFPPVLHLHLMRFQYDPVTDTNIKLNDRYEFPEKLGLDKFLKVADSIPVSYTLHAVLVHSGDNYGGHYVAYINPKGSGKWLKFDDDVVSTCSRKDAVENNFGGSDDSLGIRNCTSAYMLVYVRDSCIGDVLQDVNDDSIPQSLVNRFAEEKRLETLRRKERSEAHLYLTVEVYQEDDFQSHQGADLVDFESAKPRIFKVPKNSTYLAFHKMIAASFGHAATNIRIWPFERRSNYTFRPSFVEKPEDPKRTILHHADFKQLWRVYLETVPADIDEEDEEDMMAYDCQREVLLFYKFYDPARRMIYYMGHSIEHIMSKFSDIFPMLRERACLLPNTPLLLFEEVKPNLTDRIDPEAQLCSLEEIRDGDILCFQRGDISADRYTLPTVADYFRDIYNRIEVSFYDKNVPGDPGFTLTLNQRMNYMEMAKAVGDYIKMDPMLLQFFKPQFTSTRHLSDFPIRCNNEGSLRDFVGIRQRVDAPPILSYQRLAIPIDEFENKKLFKCVFVSMRLKEEKEFTVYVDRNGSVEDLLKEAENEIVFSEGSTKCLRLLEVLTNRITDIHPADKPITDLNSQNMFRVEEIRKEELHLKDNEALIPVAHFHKVVHNTFDVPFLLKIRDGERLSSMADRIRLLLDINEKDFDKWKFAIVKSIAPVQHLSEENDDPLYLSQFLINPAKGLDFPHMGMPWFGLDHINRNPKRTRYTIERAIKIHN